VTPGSSRCCGMVQVPPTQPEERSTDGPAAARAAAMTALGGADFESAYETGAVLDQTSVFGLEWDVHCLSTASA